MAIAPMAIEGSLLAGFLEYGSKKVCQLMYGLPPLTPDQ